MFPNNNPNLVEKLVRIRQEEILQEVQNEPKLLPFRARPEILIVLILTAVLLWFFL
jgi:hypothetical protein